MGQNHETPKPVVAPPGRLSPGNGPMNGTLNGELFNHMFHDNPIADREETRLIGSLALELDNTHNGTSNHLGTELPKRHSPKLDDDKPNTLTSSTTEHVITMDQLNRDMAFRRKKPDKEPVPFGRFGDPKLRENMDDHSFMNFHGRYEQDARDGPHSRRWRRRPPLSQNKWDRARSKTTPADSPTMAAPTARFYPHHMGYDYPPEPNSENVEPDAEPDADGARQPPNTQFFQSWHYFSTIQQSWRV